MEITKEQIIEAVKANPEFVGDLVPVIQENDVVKGLINNKAEVIYKEKIGEEVKNIYGQLDNDAFSIIGEKPQVDENGRAVQKTYDFYKEKLAELKTLREQKGSLTKDAEVQRLTAEVERLKTEGGAKHVQEVFDTAKQAWETEKSQFQQQLEEAQNQSVEFKKTTAISSAVRELKFNPDVPESLRKMAIKTAENELIANSKFEDGKLVFLDKDGKVAIDQTKYEPMTAFQMLTQMDAIKDISLKDDENKGGGAKPTINGQIQTTNVEGKDTKKLVLPSGSFKTKSEFQKVAEKALIDAGISRRDPDFTKLKDQAYIDLKVSELPAV